MDYLIARLLADLRSAPGMPDVNNQYRVAFRASNLTAYLEELIDLPYSGYLLVGEAPGYRGCALTGIPFTSPRILKGEPLPALQGLWSRAVVDRDTTEATATIVWNYLRGGSTIPAFWNIFPFHPHQIQRQASNRRPRSSEFKIGRRFFDGLIAIIQPHTIIAVGRTAQSALNSWFPCGSIFYVRHPSHGGKAEFTAGLAAAGVI